MYLLFENSYSADYFFKLYKRVRKWGGIPTGITQNVEDLLLSDTARRMLANSEFVRLLSQAQTDRQELATLFGISDQQQGYITNSDVGKGLIILGKSIIPYEDVYPENSVIYELITTKMSDDKKSDEA